MIEPGRLLTAMATPFDADGAVDYGKARKLALALLDSGSEGVVVVGTTGGVVIAGTGSNSTAEAVAATQGAEKAGVDGCLLVVPYYNKPTQEGLYQHFETIARGTNLPCILYNVPSRTITNLAPETAIRLSRVDNIVGIKEASGNLQQIAAIASGAGDGFRIWSGNDSDTLPMLALGCYGVISVASHLVGKQISEMIREFVAGNTERAAEIHRHLLPLVNALFVVANPIPLKYALGVVGFDAGKPRLPLTEPDEKTARFIRDALAGYQIDLKV